MRISDFLKTYRMVGQILPTSKNDESEPVIALLVPVSAAMAEYTLQSKQEPTRNEFIKTLRAEGVHVFNNLDEFVAMKDNLLTIQKLLKKEKKAQKRNISEERRNELKIQMKSLREKNQSTISKNP